MSDRFQSFEEFWPFYVLEHQNKTNRLLHFLGLVVGYGPAWIGHFIVEGNRPATFKYPLWSLLGDFRMWGKTLRGTMNREVERQQAKREKNDGAAHSVN
jgi:hypothetical protein